jgi:hypothetical protein
MASDRASLPAAFPVYASFLAVALLRDGGYRGVLISNTLILGLLIVLFATIGTGTPLWLIVMPAFCFGFFTSLQYTSMNTLVYPDISPDATSSASTIASTKQQMSMSFGVATASLATAFFIPDRFHSNAPEMIHGIHLAFLALGAMTVLSTVVFGDLKKGDGDNVSQFLLTPCLRALRPNSNRLAGPVWRRRYH